MSASFKITGPRGVREVQLVDNSNWKIGRDLSSAVVLNGDVVSRRHAIVQNIESGKYYLIDLGSRNGTFLNGVRVSTPSVLRNGDQVSIGTYQLQFCCDTQAPQLDVTIPGNSGTETRVMYAPSLLSVLVFDVRGYTKLTQKIDHAILCQLIGSWFREAGLIMEKYGAWAQKYIGDAVMAVWLHRDEAGKRKDAMRIVRAACEFAGSTSLLRERFALPVPFLVGAGINTGIAMVGNAGTGAYTDFTALGDVVNAAFRIESCTRQIGCEIAIGCDTMATLGAPPRFFEEHSVDLKGYDRPTTVWSSSFGMLEELLLSADPDSGPVSRRELGQSGPAKSAEIPDKPEN